MIAAAAVAAATVDIPASPDAAGAVEVLDVGEKARHGRVDGGHVRSRRQLSPRVVPVA
jgi:hypothetical protein